MRNSSLLSHTPKASSKTRTLAMPDARRSKFVLWSLFLTGLISLLLLGSTQAQPWTYDFGTGTGTANNSNSGTGNTGFFTSTPTGGGTYRVRIGTGGGSLMLVNPGTSLGTDTEVELVATTGASTNKFSVYDWDSSSYYAYVKFKFRTTSTGNGTLAFALGSAAAANNGINDNNNYVTAYNHSLPVFWIAYSGGAISAVNRRNSGSTVAITGHGFAKDTNHEVEVYASNSSSSTSYGRGGTQTLNARSWDLWVDGVKVSPDGGWPRAGNTTTLAADAALSGFAFFAESSNSPSNAARLYVDDLEYSNALPPAGCSAPSTQASAISFSSVTDLSMAVNWTNGNGAGRVVMMNTTNSFTAPSAGANPTASTTYSGSGQQVIYNGTGTGPVTVTGLSPSTTYYFRVFEYCSPDRTYASGTGTDNPNSQATAASTSPNLSATALTAFGDVCTGATAGPNSFTITGNNLTGANVTVSSLSGYTFSTTSGGTYTSTLSIPQAGGAFSQAVYVRFSPTLVQSYNGNIVVGGGGASNINVAASGAGVNPTVTVANPTSASIGTTTATLGGNITGGISCSNATVRGIEWSTTNGFTNGSGTQVSESGNYGTGTYTINVSGLPSGTTIYYKAFATNSGGTAYSPQASFVTLKAEPTNHPGSFTCGTPGPASIPLTWTDASGGTSPDGYLILWSTTSYAAISNPVDGTPVADGASAKNITQGTQSASITGLATGTTYYFKIFAYSNSGSNINYKTSPAAPQTSCATTIAPVALAQWDFFGVNNGPATLAAEVFHSALTSSDLLTRGPGASGSTANNSFRTTGFQNNGISTSNTDYFEITIGSSTNPLSITGVTAIFNGTTSFNASPGVTHQFSYSLDGSNFTLIGSPLQTTATAPPQFDFSGVSALQGISPGTTVYIRYYASGQTTTGGWGFYSANNDTYGLSVYGFVGTACTPPSTQASASSVSSTGTTVAGIDFTRGNGDGVIVTVKAGSAPTLPGNGTNYNSGNDVGGGSIVRYKGTGNGSGNTYTANITGLSAQTEYFYAIQEYASGTNCYATPAESGSFWTLSNEPTVHGTVFNTSTCASNEVTATFSAAPAGSDGYIILYRAGAAPTAVPVDGQSYSVGNTIGDATVGAIVNSTLATSAVITGLAASTTYHFVIFPYNANASATPETFNYRTSGTPLTASTTTLSVSASAQSDIITDGSYSPASSINIDYTAFQSNPVPASAANSAGVHNVIIRDGAGSDADNLPTILTGLTYSYTGTPNTIRAAALFTTTNSKVADGVVGANTITFSGMSYSTPDNGSAQLILRVTFNTTVTDNEKLIFQITSATAGDACSSSQFMNSYANSGGGGAISNTSAGSDLNRIEVTATRLRYAQQPVSAGVNSVMDPAPAVRATDDNNNIDLDFTGAVTITSTGTMTGDPIIVNAVAGVATFSNVVHTVVQTGRTLTASAAGFSPWVSSSFSITAETYEANAYRTLVAGTWVSNDATPGRWQRLVSGVWTASNAPSYNTTNEVYIRHNITSGGSYGNGVKIIVENGATFTSNHQGTMAGLTVKSGGHFIANSTFFMNSGAELFVDNNGTLTLNAEPSNPSTSVWAGVERFQPNSTVIVKDWNASPNFVTSNTDLTTNTFDGYTAAFGNLIFDFGTNLGSDNPILLNGGVSINLTHKDLIFRSNSTSITRFSTSGNITTGVGGNLIVESGFVGTINFKTSASLIMNIEGNMELLGGNVRLLAATTGTAVYNVEGDMTVATTVSCNATSVAGGIAAVVNLKGDLDVLTGGSISGGGTANPGTINFVGTGDGLTDATTQTFYYVPTVAPFMNYHVGNGAYVRQINKDLDLSITTNAPIEFRIKTGGTYDFGFNGNTPLNIIGKHSNHSFIGEAQATVVITSPDGIWVTGNNNLVGNTRGHIEESFSNTGIFHFKGKGNQVSGNILAAAGSGKVVIVELEDDNAEFSLDVSSVGISSSGGRLEIRKGIVVETPGFEFTGSGDLVMSGGTYRMFQTGVTLPNLGGTYTLTGGTVELAGNGAQTLKTSSIAYHNLAITGNNTPGINEKTIVNNPLVVNNNLTISGTSIFNTASNNVTGTGGLTMTGGRWRTSYLSSAMPGLDATAPGQSYSLTGGVLEFYGTGSTQQQTLRGTYHAGNITYYSIELNAVDANYTGGNLITNASFAVSGSFDIKSPAVLRLNPSDIVSGSGTFTVEDGAGLFYAHAQGIAATGSSGNIRVIGTRTFSTLGKYGFSGTGNMNSGTGLPSSVAGLYVTKTNTTDVVTLSNSVTVTGELIFSKGIVNTTNPFQVRLIAAATSAGAGAGSGWVNGNFVKEIGTGAGVTANFPIGDASNYGGVDLTFASVTAGGDIRSRTIGTDHPQINGLVAITPSRTANRYWTLTNQGVDFTSYNAVFNYSTADLDPSVNTSKMVVGKYASLAWSYPNVGVRTSNSVEVVNATSFSDFQAGEMMYFIWNGSQTGGYFNNDLNWVGNLQPTYQADILIPVTPRDPRVITSHTVGHVYLESGTTVFIDGGSLSATGGVTSMNAKVTGTGVGTFSIEGTHELKGGNLTIMGPAILTVIGQLTTNGRLVIEDRGELKHGPGVDGSNYGTVHGNVKFVKNGSTNPLVYNYWSSPVMNAQAGVLMNANNRMNTYAYNPLNATGVTMPELIKGWQRVSSNTIMTPGRGYITTGAGRVVFDGEVHGNTYSFTLPITQGPHTNFYLVGNPYPMPIYALSFYQHNIPNMENAIYLWDDDGSAGADYSSGDYIVSNPVGLVASGGNGHAVNYQGFIAVGQGFFVETKPGATEINFSNDMRYSWANSYFFDADSARQAELDRQAAYQRAWVSVRNNTRNEYNETLIAFIEDATDARDEHYDAKKMAGNPNLALYTTIGEVPFAIQAWGPLTTERVIPVGMDAELPGDYTFRIEELSNIDPTVLIYLQDLKTGVVHNLRGSDYNFTLTAKEKGSERFRLIFKAPVSVSVADAGCNGDKGKITIESPGTPWSYQLTGAAGELSGTTSAVGQTEISSLEEGVYTLKMSYDGYTTSVPYTVTAGSRIRVETDVPSNAYVGEAMMVEATVENATEYIWNFGNTEGSASGLSASYVFSEPGIYTVSFTARNGECSATTESLVFVREGVTGIADVDADGFAVYPNPASTHISIRFEGKTASTLQVVDLSGKMVMSRMVQPGVLNTIELNGLAAGVYQLTITDADRTRTVPLMIQH